MMGQETPGGRRTALSRLTDEELVHRISAGEAEALREVYERYKRAVYGLALRCLRVRESAEEVTLDVFTEVWKNAARYSEARARVGTWLMSIARHRAIDALRRSGSRPHRHSVGWDDLPAEALPADEETPEAMFMGDEARRRVRQAVGALPVEQAEALALAFYDGLSHSEIAQSLGQPLGTVKTRIRLALAKLARILDDRDPGQSDAPPFPK
jgi:RNA polymerase sigma-70 factor (ECF subfamily)